MNFISCHIQNSLLLCGGSESGKRNSLSSFGSWSEWAQEWLEIHSRAIRLQWHKLAARRAQILPDTDRFTWIVHCRGALAVLSTGEKKNKPVWSRTQGDVYGTALMSSGTQKYWQHSWGQRREIRKTNLNMGDLEGHGRKEAKYRLVTELESWGHSAKVACRGPAGPFPPGSIWPRTGCWSTSITPVGVLSFPWMKKNDAVRPENPSNSHTQKEQYVSKGSS